MATVPLAASPETDPRVQAVFDDIRATRKTSYVNNLWRGLAFDPLLLERTWADVKGLMAQDTLLDPLTKELVYIGVSIANACSYCVHSHTAAARAKGMTDAQHAELLALVALAAKTNHLANGLQVPLDAAFDRTVEAPSSPGRSGRQQDERIMATERVLPYAPSAIYDAFATAEVLAMWWGPEGFSNTFEVFDFRVGGTWTFDMHAPDGQRYPNRNVFTVLEPARRVVIRHDCAPYFTLSVLLTEVAGGTHLTWEQVFDDPATAQAVKAIVVPANEQNLDRLQRALAARA